jgi:hypothetical protein
MTTEKPVPWQGWALLALWASIGFIVGAISSLIGGVWPIYPGIAVLLGITVYGGVIKNWVFNIELVDPKVLKEKPE